MMLTQSNSLDCHAEREVNGVESKATVKSGEVIIEVSLSGVEEQLAKAHELVETIEKARSLADDLAKGINSIELEHKQVNSSENQNSEEAWKVTHFLG